MEGLQSDDEENSDHAVEMHDEISRVGTDGVEKSREEELRTMVGLFDHMNCAHQVAEDSEEGDQIT